MSASPPDRSEPATTRRLSLAGLVGGLVGAAVLLALPAPAGLSAAGWHCAVVGLVMATWWITEAIPIPATALVPLAAFPLLGVADIDATARPYANPIIFLFLGGFLLALAMQRHGLHRRLALAIVAAVGSGPRRIVLGFVLATGFLSMWVSNTATAMMMLPIAVSVTGLAAAGEARGRAFATALVLAIAYGANVGGLGTLIGTPPNALLAGFLRETQGVEIGFAQWLAFGLPLVGLGLPLVFAVLIRCYPLRGLTLAGGADAIAARRRELGPVSGPEITVAVVFGLVAAAWIAAPLLTAYVPGLSDAGIAMAGALLLFVLPAQRQPWQPVLDWEVAADLPWGVLLLFGGGLSLAAGVQDTGLADYIGHLLGGLDQLPLVLVMLAACATILLLTELTSNTATTAAFLPVLAALAIGLGENPLTLAVPAALAASCAFMLPVATPPNAIAFGSGHVSLPQMARTGLWLNIGFLVLITALVYSLLPLVFGVVFGQVPAWASRP
ncbi:DASS family sodium-coupled anion symporter [Spectribacter hydrogenoxidans]|uniref:DASS family sodium-coupled anion symporter n=1 Tax=Spectribacter hydrogenoxidans TaxID=3075608 RepID=A0ABU3BWN5_9GAMM|nr:DASS family sodium-coupled anion symporter [Salinisphaera sp. W335]MDT0633698.1 DASS family sodium-coupled anion symporter [Salinisphaera sp. W335]